MNTVNGQQRSGSTTFGFKCIYALFHDRVEIYKRQILFRRKIFQKIIVFIQFAVVVAI